MAVNSMYASVVYDVSHSAKKDLVFCENIEMCLDSLETSETEILNKYKNDPGYNKSELHWFVKNNTISTVKSILNIIDSRNMFPIGMTFYAYNVSFRLDLSIFLEDGFLRWRSPGMYINIYCQNQAYAYIHDSKSSELKSKTVELKRNYLNTSFLKAVKTLNNIETKNFL